MRTICGVLALLAAVSSAAADAISEVQAFLDANKPVPLALTLDDKRAVSKEIIASDGGEIVAKGADGTRYTLIIPKNALWEDAAITVTPVKSATGPLGSEKLLAVDLKPSGLVLMDVATLRIKPAKTVKDPIALSFTGVDTAVEAQAAFPLGDFTEIAVFHFSGAGMSAGSGAHAGSFLPFNDDGNNSAEEVALNQHRPQIGDADMLKRMRDYVDRRAAQMVQNGRKERIPADYANERLAYYTNVLADLDARIAAEAAKGMAFGNVGEIGKLRDVIATLVRGARTVGLNGDEKRAQELQDEATRIITEFIKALRDTCQNQAVDVITLIDVERQGMRLGAPDDAPNLMDVCDIRQYEVSVRNTMDYHFLNCSTTGSGPWLLTVSGMLSGSGKGTVDPKAFTGPWSIALSMQGLKMNMVGRMEVVHSDAEKKNPATLKVVADMATGCGSGGCASGASGKWVEAPVKTLESCQLSKG